MRIVFTTMTMLALACLAVFSHANMAHATNNKQVLQHRHTLKQEDLVELSRFLQDIEEQQVEDVFRRLQTGSSFLKEHLHHSMGGSTGTTTQSSAGQAYSYATADIAMPRAHGKPPKSTKSGSGAGLKYHQDESYGVPGRHGSSGKGSKSKKGKSSKSETTKKHKKAKKERSEKKTIDKKIAKDGYFDDDYWEHYDEYGDDWQYNDWAWEYDEEYLEEEWQYHQNSSSWMDEEEGTDYQPPDAAVDGPDSMLQIQQPELVLMDDMVGDDGNATDDYFDFDDIRPQTRAFGDFASDGPNTKQLQMPKQEFLPQMDYDGPPMRFKFPFPTIEHRVYSGPVLLKAHSSTDLSELDPEIFAVLQSVLTPYLQTIVGSTLKAYTLEVDYSPGEDKVAEGTIVTNIQVTCALKVVSDSIESLTAIDHTQVSEWIRDFFAGSELDTFLEALQNNNINVREVVFIDQEFKAGGQVIAGISSGNEGGGKKPSNTQNNGGGSSTAVIAITLTTLAVGAVLFLHFTGRLPSKEQMHDFGDRSLERMHAFGYTLRSSMHKNDRDDDLGDPLEDMHKVEEGGRKQRERTWSGTFRRHPEGGIRPAAIQKKPAMSQDYLGDSSSKGSSSSSSSSSSSRPQPKNMSRKDWKSQTEVSAVYDDYSFSVGGDCGVSNSPITPSRSDRRTHPSATSPAGSDEFTMPEEYDTVLEDETASLYSKWSHSVNMFPRGHQQNQQVHRQGAYGMSPLPPSPRRVTPADMASPYAGGGASTGGMEAWSLGSFDVQTPSARQLYRDFMGSADQGSTSSSDKSKSPKSKFGLSIPKFT